jgi:hypothetical protein
MYAAPKGARGRLSWLTWAFILLASCSHHSLITGPMRRTLAQQYVGQTFELRHTGVVGDLYDDNERELLSPYPFDEVFASVSLAGVPIHPSHPRALLPAGTQVTIVAIGYPDAHTLFSRMLATPRHAIWLQLQIVPLHPDRVQVHRPPLILPLGAHAQSVASVDAAIARYLAPNHEVSSWLQGRNPKIAVAIAHKEIQSGMQVTELEAAYGPPWRWFVDKLPDQSAVRVAWYPKIEVWLQDQTVIATHPSRPIP